MLIGHESCRSGPLESLTRHGFQCVAKDDPYAAMAELSRRPLAYRAIVISLQSIYHEELNFIAAVKRRWPYLEMWLTHTDGRAAALADAMRLGAVGLLAEDGQWHRTAITSTPAMGIAPSAGGDAARGLTTVSPPIAEAANASDEAPGETADVLYMDENTGEPVLSAEELRALLQEPPAATSPTGNER